MKTPGKKAGLLLTLSIALSLALHLSVVISVVITINEAAAAVLQLAAAATEPPRGPDGPETYKGPLYVKNDVQRP